ncbi:uncharacterized protein LOC141628881 [Silene latifolia]|uniref:uncharacterized protein LOC141628881 n=1 Tax=Silene latifolia TaxID=37657 RepID=UPI003D786CA3
MFIVNVKDMTAQAIHTKVYDKIRRKGFWYTLVYGFNKAAERENLWSCLRSYHRIIIGPWMACGDFNSVMDINEHMGGANDTRVHIIPLNKVTHDCHLFDLKATGAFFTWNNKHESGEKVYSRIDRVLINDDWIIEFRDSVVNFVPEGLFNHCPCLTNFEVQHHLRPKPFKYFNMWVLAMDFDNIVSN